MLRVQGSRMCSTADKLACVFMSCNTVQHPVRRFCRPCGTVWSLLEAFPQVSLLDPSPLLRSQMRAVVSRHHSDGGGMFVVRGHGREKDFHMSKAT